MPHERLRPSFVFDEERLKQLQQIVPEAFADGNINWEVLKESLGEHLEEEGAEAEHFGLFWPGKREARKIASIPSQGALIPVKGEGINEETTKNIFIEGENLEVLKLLQKSYVGRINMIYIDPPYNTGNDFVYDDNFAEPLEEYLKYSGQMDEEGKVLTTNTKADGRFHSKWLSMMYPRLRLARNLLADEGMIFISIDDNEVGHLRKICDEIFGEENFIGQIIRLTGSTRNMAVTIDIRHDYVLVYSKNYKEAKIIGLERLNTNEFINPDSDPEGEWSTQDLTVRTGGHEYEIPAINGMKFFKRRWRYDEKRMKRIMGSMETDDFISIYKKKSKIVTIKENKWIIVGQIVFKGENNTPNLKKYLKDVTTITVNSIWDDIDSQKIANETVKRLFNGKQIFNNPKPVNLIQKMTNIALESDGIILDFFAGSGTLGEAILKLNFENKKMHRFICIQMPENIDEDSEAYKAGYRTISDIGKERIRRVIKMLKEERKGKKNLEGASVQDRGFKVLKLNKSNFKQWQNYKGKDQKELTSLFKEHEIPLIDGWKPENLLIEVMLQEGFPLDSEIVELKEHKKNAVIYIKSEFCEHKLLVCFDKKIYQETINALDIQGEDIFVCLDSALSDEQKITLSDKGFLKTI